jgi:hypothetical protein
MDYGGLNEMDIANKLVYLEQMKLPSFTMWKMGWWSNWCKSTFHLWMVSIVWYTPPILLFIHWTIWVWFQRSSFYWCPCTTIFATTLSAILKLWNLNYFNRKVKCFWRTSRHWISMLSPSKCVLNKYKALIVKMAKDSSTIDIAKPNCKLLCDVETFLGFTCVLPLLEAMQCLTKFAEGH